MAFRLVLFVCMVQVLQTRVAVGSTIVGLVEHTFEGRFAFFGVPRERIAAKLEELQQSSCNEELLNLPNDPVLQDFIGPDEHIVAVVYGKINATTFEESLPNALHSEYETQADTVQFYIPMLTGSDRNAKPIYKLSLGSFVATDKPFLQPNVAVPTKQVDSIEVTEGGLVMTDGCEKFEVAWSTFGACEEPKSVIDQDFNEYIDDVMVSIQKIPNYPFCENTGLYQATVCNSCGIVNYACQVWTHGKVKSCREDSFSVKYITPKFGRVSLLTDGPQDAFITEYNIGSYGVGVRKPCFD